MPLPSSPPIDLLAVYTEFGAPVGTPLTALVRGGAYVPDTPTNAGVPTAPPIDLLDFLGASAVDPLDFTFSPTSASGSEFRSEPAPATLPVSTNVVSTIVTGGTGSTSYLWEYVSGSTAFGTASSTGSSRSWSVAALPKNTQVDAVWKCTVTRGIESVAHSLNVHAEYNTDL